MQHYIDGQLYSKIKEVSYGTGADEKTQPEHAIHCEVILVTLTILQGYIMCILIFSPPPFLRLIFFPRQISLRRAGEFIAQIAAFFKAFFPFLI